MKAKMQYNVDNLIGQADNKEQEESIESKYL